MKQVDFKLYAAAFNLLHSPFLAPPQQAWLDDSTTVSAFQAWPFSNSSSSAQALAQLLHQEPAESISRDYYRLFIGPGPMKSPPYGSAYTDRENLLFGVSSMEFDAFCKQHGIVIQTQEGAPSDHIGLILGLLAHLLECRQDLVVPLMEDHLLPWSRRMLELVSDCALTGFYRHLAVMSQNTIQQLSSELACCHRPQSLFL